MKVYAMFDKKSHEHFAIALWQNDDLYCRSITSVVNIKNPDNLLNTHTSDFELWCLGEFDQSIGEFTNGKYFVCSADDLKKEDVNV